METRVAAVVVKDKKFLIIRSRQSPDKWVLPGGMAEEKEKVLEALKRELEEEVGIEIEDRFDFLWERVYKNPKGKEIKNFCFRVWPKNREVKLEAGRGEYAWITVEELDKYDFRPGLKEKLKENSWKWLKRPE